MSSHTDIHGETHCSGGDDPLPGPLLLPGGSASAPGYAFTGDDNTGLFSAIADTVSIAAGGAEVARFTTTQQLGLAGTAVAPAYSFIDDPNTGIYSAGADQLGFSTGGTLRVTINSSVCLTTTIPVRAANGATATPSFAFTNETNTGMYLNGAGTLAFSVGGTNRLQVAAAGITAGAVINAANAGYKFVNETNTGMYLNGATVLGFDVAGTPRITVDGTANAMITLGYVIRNVSGTAALPAYSFTSDTNTGMYYVGADQIGFSTGGTLRLTINAATSIISTLPFRGPNGSTTAPTYSFSGDVDCGFYYVATYVGLTIGGTRRFFFDAGGIGMDSGCTIRSQRGSSTDAPYQFDGDPNTGMYSPAADQVALVAGGVAVLSSTTTTCTFGVSLNVSAKDIATDTTTGTKIGTASTQKLGFFGATPVVQQAHIADPSGGTTVDAEARTAINSILARLETFGFSATA